MEWLAVKNPERLGQNLCSPFHRVSFRAKMYPIDSEANHREIYLLKFILIRQQSYVVEITNPFASLTDCLS
jgi:hypothetical protein